MIDDKKEEVNEDVIEDVIEDVTEEVNEDVTEVNEDVTEVNEDVTEAPKKREIISREGVMILLGYDGEEGLSERDEALINETYWRFNRVIID